MSETINLLAYELRVPDPLLTDFVERFWRLQNLSGEDKEIVLVPDGRIDLLFTCAPDEPFRIGLVGLETKPSQHTFFADTLMFGLNLKLLGAECLLDMRISSLVNGLELLPEGFWGISEGDLDDFDSFCKKVSDQLMGLIHPPIEARKKKLFDLIYASHGAMNVGELSEEVQWSSRQINRYFNQQYGLSLKAFCDILRFRASFTQIKQGQLFPDQNFSDQPHFVKAVKKLAGVSPKALFKNQDDRFVQFSTLDAG